MKTFDLSPMFRSGLGLDDSGALLDQSFIFDNDTTAYPPYDIEAFSDGKYWIRLAVAGFDPDDLKINVENDVLTIKGEHVDPENGGHMVYQSITRKTFVRNFELTDHIDILGARLKHGLLTIELQKNRPDVTKPHTVEIQSED